MATFGCIACALSKMASAFSMHSELKIAARSKDMPLPIRFQGIGAS